MNIQSKIFIICFLVWGAKNLKAQEAVTVAGGDATGTGGTAAYSVGQVGYTNISSASGSIDQGVQQSYIISSTGENTNPDINLMISVYPNPSISFMRLKVENHDLQNLSFQLFDVQGNLLINKKITNAETSIAMSEFASGNYVLKVTDNKSELKTFKINKN